MVDLDMRLTALKNAIAKMDILTDEERGMYREVVNMLATIDTTSDEAVGKIVLLEAALNVKPPVSRELEK